MWKIVAEIVCVVALMRGQVFNDLLLPEARHIAGVVVDSEGTPVAGARIDHSNDRRQLPETDANGRFALDTRAPSVVIRKSGFRSEFVRTQDARDLRIELRKLAERPFPACPDTGSYIGLDGHSTFRFPMVPGVKASGQGRDIDYGARSYYVKTRAGRKGISHGSGPMWSFGIPLDEDVWRSVKYGETAYDSGGLTIVDARGQLANGHWWRYLGKIGESASYFDVDEATAKALDRFLDGACATRSSGR